jgi:hypothetical protein
MNGHWLNLNGAIRGIAMEIVPPSYRLDDGGQCCERINGGNSADRSKTTDNDGIAKEIFKISARKKCDLAARDFSDSSLPGASSGCSGFDISERITAEGLHPPGIRDLRCVFCSKRFILVPRSTKTQFEMEVKSRFLNLFELGY